ncbi:hypothetical protein JT245_05760, partial [Helicobacter pylori]|nr:hypothetical protein [Helicobacter pylori]
AIISPCIEFNSVSPTGLKAASKRRISPPFKNGAYGIKWFENAVWVNERGNNKVNKRENNKK